MHPQVIYSRDISRCNKIYSRCTRDSSRCNRIYSRCPLRGRLTSVCESDVKGAVVTGHPARSSISALFKTPVGGVFHIGTPTARGW
jgi:hypothetical protein